MGLERCGYCEAPIYVRLAAIWNDDGTITGRFARQTRVVQMYAQEITHILRGIGERIGFDISRIVVEGERKASRQFTNSILGRWNGRVGHIARSRPFDRLVLEFVARGANNAGLGCSRVKQYAGGSRLAIEVGNPFNIPILAGNILGAFEAFFEKPGQVSWEGDEGSVLITVEGRAVVGTFEERRLEPVLPPTSEGRFTLRRCPRCNTPLDVTSRYHFDMKKGIAIEVATSRRVVTVMIDSLNAIFKELEAELGPQVGEMIVELESDFRRTSLEGGGSIDDGEAEIARLLSDLRVKGQGNPLEVCLSEGQELTVEIANPFSEELVSGIVRGCYLGVLGEPAEVEWTSGEKGTMAVVVHR